MPAGFSPVEVGRMGLWLLGKRQHRLAKKRRARNRTRAYLRCLAGRWGMVVCPWRVWEYPTAEILIARLCGVAEATAHHWLMSKEDILPAKHARTLADYVERFDGPAVARELRKYADERDKRVKRVKVIGRSPNG